MALFNLFHETEADSAYDKGLVRYFDAYRLTNKGGTSYQYFSNSIYIYITKAPSLNQIKFCLEHNLSILFDIGFFEPSAGEGHEAPHHNFVLLL